MAKFYVTCGGFEEIVEADEARQAALWAMHLMMEKVVPLDEMDWVESENLAIAKYKSGFSDLGDRVLVSERGFRNSECEDLATEAVMKEWNQLLVAVSRIDRMLSQRRDV